MQRSQLFIKNDSTNNKENLAKAKCKNIWVNQKNPVKWKTTAGFLICLHISIQIQKISNQDRQHLSFPAIKNLDDKLYQQPKKAYKCVNSAFFLI